MTPLRQRFVEDLKLRNRSAKTIEAYVSHVARFARHFGRCPEQLSAEHARQDQLHLLEHIRVARGKGNKHAVRQTLLEVAADPKHLGAAIGGLMVLHTWGQNLGLHPHVHVVVPGGPPEADRPTARGGSPVQRVSSCR